MTRFSAILIGNESLAVQCGEAILAGGHEIRAVVTRTDDIADWARGNGLRVETPGPDLAQRLGQGADWLFSIANLDVIPEPVLALAGRGAINFHDGPLPAYAGLNAPVWALLNGESRHGVTWHLIGGGIDEGDILEQRLFDIAPGDTALTLNARCYEAGIESFATLLTALEGGDPPRRAQDLEQRSYFGLDARPPAAARLDFTRDAAELARIVRALDHGDYANPLACPKIEAADRVVLVGQAREAEGAGAPGTVLEVSETGLLVACGTGALRLGVLRDNDGAPVDLATQVRPGDVLASPSAAEAEALDAALARIARGEPWVRRRLQVLDPGTLPLGAGGGVVAQIALNLPPMAEARLMALAAACIAGSMGASECDLALRDEAIARGARPGYVSGWVPVHFGGAVAFGEAARRFEAEVAQARRAGGFALDLPARDPAITGAVPQAGLDLSGARGLIPGTGLTLKLGEAPALHYDDRALSPAMAALLAARLEHLARAEGLDAAPLSALPLVPEGERRQLAAWNATETPFEAETIHHLFERQAARTPDAVALSFEGEDLSYAQLDARANRVAHVLRGMGVVPGTVVGLCTRRSVDMIAGALGILKAGGAYLPLDPAYPADRLALYLEDSAAPVVVTQSALVPELPPHRADILCLDTDPRLATAPATDPEGGATPDDLAYLIYTSGSTGRPKGVMVEHRNVANFFRGMDEVIDHDPPGVWLSVTSLSFDISVLELFWTLARGFKLVLSGDEDRALISRGGVAVSDRRMEFSLYYWGNDDGVGRDKYRSLLEGAKFADAHGFCAVWTPERHFHAFGGPYPNPSVTGAAVAAVTKNIGVRAGSVVAPLHHTARIAEEWAVIDNLTNGRAGLAIASGWQPDDFVLRPENTPPANKPAMYRQIEDLRRLWAGQPVAFPRKDGSLHEVVTQPRPVSAELPIWVTTAGNPDTWKEAGALGANVLTHLLGQDIDEVAGKIELYHAALREAGHDPADHTVTLMLHSFVGADRDAVRETARGPMKDYLRSAAGLIKQYAWAFPAFKKPMGVESPMQLDLGILSEEELDAILDFAFLRYFDDSGLFGTVEDCLDRVERLKRIGVDEIACLIDYGIPVEQVLEGLVPLAEVLRRANTPTAPAADDWSIAAQIRRHGVTHLQCTPSMARMIAMNEDAGASLAHVRHLLVGGEPLPGTLVSELGRLTNADITNMYGPTETTIWSSTEPAGMAEPVVNIGRPIANTRLHVLDEDLAPVPVGVAGELWIGGAGVTRGYWKRPDLTADRFRPDPFAEAGSRMYRTGDLVRRRADGKLDFLGRVDHQVKLRGYRIEPGEIEAALETMPGITQAVVAAREDRPGDFRLVGYVTAESPVDEAAMREHLSAHLPAHMVPSQFVTLERFPLTPNRKVDRNALPAPRPPAPQVEEAAEVDQAELQGDLQTRIAAIWSRVLGVARVGAKDNFFELGGHSLLAVQAHRDLRAELGVAGLAITDIFRFPTLAGLAGRVAELTGRRAGAEARAAEPPAAEQPAP
ncbi:MAG: MupA/Atu3671 family FMN-dependent luciferase-like monooxygenase, partial [Paracoccaceae bacterium]